MNRLLFWGFLFISYFPFCCEANEIVSKESKTTTFGSNQTEVTPNFHDPLSNGSIKIHHFKSAHIQFLMVYVGEGSNVIVCLSKNHSSEVYNFSTVFISYDYGDTYANKTEFFKLSNGSYSTVNKLYTHPVKKTQLIFTDIIHKHIFVTVDLGKTISRIALNFTPSEVQLPNTISDEILILDKTSPDRILWYSSNLGSTFNALHQHVSSWIINRNYLILQNTSSSGMSALIYSNVSSLNKFKTFQEDIVDMSIKENYIFYVKKSTSNDYDLFVSYNFDAPMLCNFSTKLKKRAYQIVDVTNDKAMVAVSHTEVISHLYISEILNKGRNDGSNLSFALSMENVLAHFQNYSFPNSRLSDFTKDSFTDIYKVEGLTGIYIATQLVNISTTQQNLSPEYLVSKITFDHGASWRLIKAPEEDMKDQVGSCTTNSNCSLHLTQRFSQLRHDSQTSILSSRSAPGVLVATGVTGLNLKGQYGTYVSSDAGLTWKKSFRDEHFFNVGDFGGLFTAATSKTLSKSLFYSTDLGENWQEVYFDKEGVTLYGLLTEPGKNTTVFTLYGSKMQQNEWVTVKISLRDIFKRNCSKTDYVIWTPNAIVDDQRVIPCPQGKQKAYQRRIPEVECYNGDNYNRSIWEVSCACISDDYECDIGFTMDEFYGRCIRNKSSKFDPYEIPQTCQTGQTYNRTKGYKKIVGNICAEPRFNSYTPDIIPCPIKETLPFLLISQRDKIVRLNPVTRDKQDITVANFTDIIAIDFDMKNNCLFYADNMKNIIGRQCPNGNTPGILVDSNLSSVEAISYDWISRNLYFINGWSNKIELVRVDVIQPRHYRRTILALSKPQHPKAIVVHPIAEFLFWTDWSSNPSISRSNLIGDNVTQLFGSPIVYGPNGITIDYIAERIYWVDTKLDYIGSSNFYGNKFIKVLHGSKFVMHPYSVTVFKDTVYWNEWSTNGTFSADKDFGIDLKMLTKEKHGTDIKIYGNSMQEGSNACTNSTCQYICVSINNKPVCLCPLELDVKADKCICPGGIESYSNMSCPMFQGTCGPNYFQCNDGQCIPQSWQCDESKDCSSGEDEVNCSRATCEATYFRCDNGTCIPNQFVCDNHKHCTDGSDEHNCSKNVSLAQPTCSNDSFNCDIYRCYHMMYYCDGYSHCKDGTDENNCTKKILKMSVHNINKTDSSLVLNWEISNPQNEKYQFLPSIRKVTNDIWQNETWTESLNYTFRNLEPYTKYNMTVYVRITNTQEIIPPIKFYTTTTTEGLPSVPLNVSATQVNNSHVLISWNEPTYIHGIIKTYEVRFYPSTSQTQTYSYKSTSCLLSANFEPGRKYSFCVIANNGIYASDTSEVVTILFDKYMEIGEVKKLRILQQTHSSVSLAWMYENPYDEFVIEILVSPPYPKLMSRKTRNKNITFSDLAPGVSYRFKITPRRREFRGLGQVIEAKTIGIPLPEVPNLQATVNNNDGTSVIVKWKAPQDSRKMEWKYGVYYGVSEDELFEKSRFNTSTLVATINNLEACRTYMFAVGLVGPFGVGPLQIAFQAINTFFNIRAPPTNLVVTQGPRGHNTMLIKWSPACLNTNQTIGYIILITEMRGNLTTTVNLKNTSQREISHTFLITFGGHYRVVVSTDVKDGRSTQAIIYKAPPVPVVFDVSVQREALKSYGIYWQEYNGKTLKIANVSFEYEVLVSVGNQIEEATALRFEVKNPPLMYSNITANMYSFAVSIKTQHGYRSALSNVITINTPNIAKQISNTLDTNLRTASLVIGLMLIVSTIPVYLLCIRNRRNSGRFNARDVVTFNYRGLQNEENVQMQTFSEEEMRSLLPPQR